MREMHARGAQKKRKENRQNVERIQDGMILMVNIQKIKCNECGEEFERDMDDPAVRAFYNDMGAVADQCNKCLRKMLRGD